MAPLFVILLHAVRAIVAAEIAKVTARASNDTHAGRIAEGERVIAYATIRSTLRLRDRLDLVGWLDGAVSRALHGDDASGRLGRLVTCGCGAVHTRARFDALPRLPAGDLQETFDEAWTDPRYVVLRICPCGSTRARHQTSAEQVRDDARMTARLDAALAEDAREWARLEAECRAAQDVALTIHDCTRTGMTEDEAKQYVRDALAIGHQADVDALPDHVPCGGAEDPCGVCADCTAALRADEAYRAWVQERHDRALAAMDADVDWQREARSHYHADVLPRGVRVSA